MLSSHTLEKGKEDEPCKKRKNLGRGPGELFILPGGEKNLRPHQMGFQALTPRHGGSVRELGVTMLAIHPADLIINE